MPRDGSNIYTKPAGTTAVANTTIESAKFNLVIDDLVTDANTPRAIVAGGTGASTASGARTALAVPGTADNATVTGDWTFSGDLVFSGSPDFSGVGNASTIRTDLGLGSAAVLAEVTSAEYRSNTADRALSTDQVWGAMAEVTLTDGASIALDLSTGFDFTVTLGGNRTLANPTNAKVGQRGRIRVVQDATGSRTLAYGTSYEFALGTAPTLTATASAEDVIYYDVISSTRILLTIVKDIS